jgi:3D (Asp-Asp-Asp) domain-containing protein
MKRVFTILVFALVCSANLFAREQTILARITVYWPAGANDRACSNGVKLQSGHCAVDPKRIPYGSKVLFPDTTCVAVDSGPAVVSRTAARLSGKTALQRAALVIDRYFETKKQALSWAASHPHFMTLQVLEPHHKAPPASEPPRANEPTKNVAPWAAAADVLQFPMPRPTDFYLRNTDVAPADVRGPLVPTLAITSMLRS